MGPKRSQRRSVRYENDQSGCMWGLISMFDFRQVRNNHKLIADKKHGSKHISGSGISKNKFEVLRNLEENFKGIIDGEESTMVTVTNACIKPSVKKLIEEEMVNERFPKKEARDLAELKQTEPADEDHTKAGHKKSKKNRKKSRDMDNPNQDVAENLQNDTDRQSVKDLGIDEIMAEFSRRIHQKSTSRMEDSDFDEKLKAAIKEFIVQKLTKGKLLKEDQKTGDSKELMNELELMSSDEELFRKLVQDPKSLLVKYAQNLQGLKLEKDEEPASGGLVSKPEEDVVGHKHRSFFRRKVKSTQEKNPVKEDDHSDTLNRIVILKPSPLLRSSEPKTSLVLSSQETRNIGGGSHFFISEIKRRLKHAMGKQHYETARTETLGKPSDMRRAKGDSEKGIAKGNIGINSPTKEHFYIERMTKPFSGGGSKRADKTNKTKDSEPSVPNERISNIYIEAKKHLSEMLSTGDDGEISSRQNLKTLGRILAIPEYNTSPVGSPRRDWEKSFVTARTRFSSNDKLQNADDSPVREAKNLDSPTPVTVSSSDHEVQAPNSNCIVSDDIVHEIKIEETVKEEMSREDDSTRLKEEEEENAILDGSLELSGSPSPREDQSFYGPVVSEDNTQFACLERDSNEENLLHSSPPGSPSGSLIGSKALDLQIVPELQERPSPVSVLELVFADDDITSADPVSPTIKLTIQPLRIQFEEPDSPTKDEVPRGKSFTDDKDAIFTYVKAVIQSSGFDWDEVCIKLLSSDQLLDLVSLDEVELFSNQLCCDEMLLFDCINEVLVELCRYYFGSSPWVLFMKSGIRPIPDTKDVTLETSKGVYWQLLQPPLPRTLDQIVGKDMERTRTWMDTRFDAETIGFDMGEAILEDLMEDTILSYVDESSEPTLES